MRRSDAHELIEALTGLELSARIAAFDAIEKIDDVEAVFVLLRESDGRSYPVARALTRRVVAMANASGDIGLPSLLRLALDGRRQGFRYHELIYQVSHAVVNSDRLWHGQKGSVIVASLRLAASLTPRPNKTSVTYLIQASGFLRAVDALAIFPTFLASSDDDLTFEVLQACRSMNDPAARDFLPAIFLSPNAKISEMALELFCSFGSPRARLLQIERLYRELEPSIRERLIRCHHAGKREWQARVYARLYRMERDPGRRSQIINRLGSTDCAAAADVLVRIAADDDEPECRFVASASLRAMPAVDVMKTLRRGLKSPVDSYRRWAFTKAGDLPPSAARALLAPSLAAWNKLNRDVRPFLIETIAKLAIGSPRESRLVEWLIARLGDQDVGHVALTGLLRRLSRLWAPLGSLLYYRSAKDAAILLRELGRAKPPSISDLAAALNLPALLRHPDLEIRYAAASLLLQSGDPRNVANVFRAAALEAANCAALFVDLLIDRAGASPRTLVALALDLDSQGQPDDGSARPVTLVTRVCEKVEPSAWRDADWAALVTILLRHAVVEDYQSLAFDDEVARGLFDFCLRHVELWAEGLNAALIAEDNPLHLCVYAAVARSYRHLVRADTSLTLSDRLERGAIRALPGVVELLIECGEERAFATVIKWLDDDNNRTDPGIVRILSTIVDPRRLFEVKRDDRRAS